MPACPISSGSSCATAARATRRSAPPPSPRSPPAIAPPETPPVPEAFDVVIYHNPACGTSRNTLAMIRHAGIEPHVVEYLKTPPSRALIRSCSPAPALSVRDVLRDTGTPYADLGLGDPALTDERLLDAIGPTRSCSTAPSWSARGRAPVRPSEAVLDLLPRPAGRVREGGRRARRRRARPPRRHHLRQPDVPVRTLPDRLGRALHRRRHRARPRHAGRFHAVGAAEVAKVNLPVAALIWLMVIPMLLKIDFASLRHVGRHWRGIG